jgi:hypothetical protein
MSAAEWLSTLEAHTPAPRRPEERRGAGCHLEQSLPQAQSTLMGLYVPIRNLRVLPDEFLAVAATRYVWLGSRSIRLTSKVQRPPKAEIHWPS